MYSIKPRIIHNTQTLINIVSQYQFDFVFNITEMLCHSSGNIYHYVTLSSNPQISRLNLTDFFLNHDRILIINLLYCHTHDVMVPQTAGN